MRALMRDATERVCVSSPMPYTIEARVDPGLCLTVTGNSDQVTDSSKGVKITKGERIKNVNTTASSVVPAGFAPHLVLAQILQEGIEKSKQLPTNPVTDD